MIIAEPQLVQRAKGGDQAAFETLFRRYQDVMYRFALHFTGSREEAADITQDAFVRAWEQLPRLRVDAAFGGWLRAIVLNLARDGLRRRGGAEATIEDDPSGVERLRDQTPGPEDGFVSQELETAVRRAVLSLPEHQRAVVVMHYLEDLSVDQIATDLGMKKGTVVSRLARGRDLLKRKLAGRI